MFRVPKVVLFQGGHRGSVGLSLSLSLSLSVFGRQSVAAAQLENGANELGADFGHGHPALTGTPVAPKFDRLLSRKDEVQPLPGAQNYVK